MFISHCPHCHEGFRIPAGEIPEDAYARCPWCHETFPVSEVWDRLPPTLEIIRADGTPLVSAEAATSIVGSGLKLVESRGPQPPSGFGAQDLTDWAEDDSVNDLANAEIMDEDPHATLADESVHQTIVDEDWHERMAGVASRDVELHSDEDPDETWDTAETTSSIQSMNVSTKGNARTKRKGSGIGTFIGIVLGGLLSLPIAGGILMLLGRTPDWGFGRSMDSRLPARYEPQHRGPNVPTRPTAALPAGPPSVSTASHRRSTTRPTRQRRPRGKSWGRRHPIPLAATSSTSLSCWMMRRRRTCASVTATPAPLPQARSKTLRRRKRTRKQRVSMQPRSLLHGRNQVIRVRCSRGTPAPSRRLLPRACRLRAPKNWRRGPHK